MKEKRRGFDEVTEKDIEDLEDLEIRGQDLSGVLHESGGVGEDVEVQVRPYVLSGQAPRVTLGEKEK